MANVVIVDSACDLPESVLRSKCLAVLPLNIQLGGNLIPDHFTPEQRLKIIEDGTLNIKHDDASSPATRDQIVEFLTKRILPNYDFAMVQTVARNSSPQFEMWYEVNMSYSAHYRKYRQREATFTLRTTDSGTMFTGQGLMALNALYLNQKRIPHRQLIDHCKKFTNYIQSYSAPADLHYMRARTQKRGDRSISFLAAHLGSALNITPIVFGGQNTTGPVAKIKGHTNAINRIIDHAIDSIEQGLKTPFISISYAGRLNELKDIEKYKELLTKAKKHNVKVAASVATLTQIINLGSGNFSLAIAPNDAQYKISA